MTSSFAVSPEGSHMYLLSKWEIALRQPPRNLCLEVGPVLCKGHDMHGSAYALVTRASPPFEVGRIGALHRIASSIAQRLWLRLCREATALRIVLEAKGLSQTKLLNFCNFSVKIATRNKRKRIQAAKALHIRTDSREWFMEVTRGGMMTELHWEEWLSLEGCVKSEGSEVVWFINPTVDEKWYLSKLPKQIGDLFPMEVGIFLSIEEAMDSAQRLENRWIH